MKRSVYYKIFTAILIAVVLLSAGIPSAHADTEFWMVPWTWLNSGESICPYIVTIRSTDVNETVAATNALGYNSTPYGGYYHYIDFVFQKNNDSSMSVGLIAPASGTVTESWNGGLAVRTNDGDLYRIQIDGRTMSEFSVGSVLEQGDQIGYIEYASYAHDDYSGLHAHLTFEYSVGSEQDYLFCVSKWMFTNGVDVNALNPYFYDPPEVDLVADPIMAYGWESPNLEGIDVPFVWEPNSLITFDSGITNNGDLDAAQEFNVKWYINGYQVGYGRHAPVPAKVDMTEDNSFLRMSFSPGTYYIEFVVDCDWYIPESNETNNTAGMYITVGY